VFDGEGWADATATMQKPGSHLKISIATTAIVMKAAIELGELAVALNQSIHLQ
jgi:hypothetical protein